MIEESSYHPWSTKVATSCGNASYGCACQIRVSYVRMPLSATRNASLQFLSSHYLLHISRIRVEHEDQSLVVEVGHLTVKGGYVVDLIAFGYCMTRDWIPRGFVVKQQVMLGGEKSESHKYGFASESLKAYSEELRSNPRFATSEPVTRAV